MTTLNSRAHMSPRSSMRAACLPIALLALLLRGTGGCDVRPSERVDRAPAETCERGEQCRFGRCEGGYCAGGECDPGCDAGWTCITYQGFLSSGSECKLQCGGDDDCPHTWGCDDAICSFPRPLTFSMTGPATGATGEELAFAVDVTRSAGAASFVWSVQNTATEKWEGLTGTSEQITHAFPGPGYWAVRATVADEASQESDALVVTITSDTGSVCSNGAEPNCSEGLDCYESEAGDFACYPPLSVFIETETTGWKIPPGEMVTFEASWQDVDPDPGVTFSWFAQGEKIGDGPVLKHAFSEHGTFMLRLSARDEVGRAAEHEMEISVCANEGTACDENTYCCGNSAWCHLADAVPTCYP